MCALCTKKVYVDGNKNNIYRHPTLTRVLRPFSLGSEQYMHERPCRNPTGEKWNLITFWQQ